MSENDCNCGKSDRDQNAILGDILKNLGKIVTDVGLLLGAGSEVGEEPPKDEVFGHKLPDGYKPCRKGTCDRDTDVNGHYFCPLKQTTCTNAGAVCDCHLFRFDKNKEKAPWEHIADPGVSDPDLPDNVNYFYKCICVETKK